MKVNIAIALFHEVYSSFLLGASTNFDLLNKIAQDWLDEHHHAGCDAAVKFVALELNDDYVNDIERIILERKVEVWLDFLVSFQTYKILEEYPPEGYEITAVIDLVDSSIRTYRDDISSARYYI
jgi:hypothetical protein